jgi:hypothetical protein
MALLIFTTYILVTIFDPFVPQIFVVEFFFEVLEKLSLCEKLPHEKSYLDILNGNQDINKLRIFVFYQRIVTL